MINSPNKHVFGLWEEAGVTGENPRMHRENMQTPHRKAGAKIRTIIISIIANRKKAEVIQHHLLLAH